MPSMGTGFRQAMKMPASATNVSVCNEVMECRVSSMGELCYDMGAVKTRKRVPECDASCKNISAVNKWMENLLLVYLLDWWRETLMY